MSLYDDYAAFTATTAIYPDQVAAPYLALGLCSEAAECIELIYAQSNVSLLGHELGGEMGDVMWYSARLAATYDLDFDALVRRAKNSRSHTNEVADLHKTLDEITMRSGLIAGKIKKQLRDGQKWTGEQREDARRYINEQLISILRLTIDVTDWLYAHHNAEYSSLDKLLQMNRKKLESRQSRGVLGGDGSNR